MLKDISRFRIFQICCLLIIFFSLGVLYGHNKGCKLQEDIIKISEENNALCKEQGFDLIYKNNLRGFYDPSLDIVCMKMSSQNVKDYVETLDHELTHGLVNEDPKHFCSNYCSVFK